MAELATAILQCVGVGGAVVGGIWIKHASGRGDSCCIRDRTGRGGADCAGGLVGDRACRWHRNGVVNIAAATGAEPGSPTVLGGGIGDAGEGAREGIANDRASDLARPSVCRHNRVGVFCAGNGRCLAIANGDLQVGLKGDGVGIGGTVVSKIGMLIPLGLVTLALSETVPVAAALSLPVAL